MKEYVTPTIKVTPIIQSAILKTSDTEVDVSEE